MKKSLFSLLFFLMSGYISYAQAIVTIGTGTASTLYGPVYLYSNTSPNTHSWYLCIYNPGEIISNGGASGLITALSWYKNDTGAYLGGDASYEIYMKSTTLADFSAGAGNFNNEYTGASLVYSSTTSGLPASTGWVNYPLSAPFSWNGTDNIMILTRWVRIGAGTGAVNWASTSITPNHVSTSFNSSATMGSLYSFANRPNIKLYITTATGIMNGVINDADISIYPNPASDRLNIILKDIHSEAHIRIYSVPGSVFTEQHVFPGSSGESLALNIEFLPPGIYFLDIILPGRILKKKFIKTGVD
ncbi:MAG: T9SS type A sorting domain-containing protein [Bacteroidetes bacterium]|nr:T9SS type A sorting domain-containing protein [Bacteroidota bacterium]